MTDLSNHNHHDLDLIAAQASGERSDRAEAWLASCHECRLEYEAQKKVQSWLAAAPVIKLADHEREALHHRVSTQIVHSQALAPVTRPPAYWLFRLGAAAAALAVLAGLTGVLGRLGAGSGGVPTTAAATEAMIDLDESAGAAPATTAAGGGTVAGMLAAQEAPESRALPGGDAAAVRREIEILLEETTSEVTSDARVAAPPCVEEIQGLTPLRWAESSLEGEPIVIIIVEAEEGAAARIYTIDRCELVEL